jgi:hypothetical protein
MAHHLVRWAWKRRVAAGEAACTSRGQTSRPKAHRNLPRTRWAEWRGDWGSLKPIKAEQFGEREARHLLWRAGFGGTAQQIKTLAGWGPEKAVDHLLELDKIEFEPPKEDTFDADILRPAHR